MNRSRISILSSCALVIGVAAWAAARKPAPAYAAEHGTTAGQLTILGKDGKPAGLCPLRHTDVLADIAGYVSRVTVTQEFANPSTTPVEAVYTFPLPSDAAVDDMIMTIGKRVIRGQILKREEARAVYEAAKTHGQAAALLDQERPNIFTQSVANIMPGDPVKITIRYVNLLKYQEGRYEFMFPMVVGPRFVPSGGYSAPGKRGGPNKHPIPDNPGATSVVNDPEKITPPITPKGTRAGHDISVQVNLDAGLPIRQVASVLHDVDIRRAGHTRAVIRLKDEATIPNKDFILRYTAAGSEIQSGVLAHSTLQAGVAGRLEAIPACNGYFTLILNPPAAPPREMIAPKEMVFVIDQTGSQMGWPIAMAKETMRYCMKNMNPGDTFQLLAFNTNVYPCFDKPVPATNETVAKALKFLEPIEGNGGTDILKAVDYALKIPDDPNRLRIICYMTDGYVGNDMQIIDYVRKYRGRARMFPFGVGNSVNRFLIDGMAREGRGEPEYVAVQMNGGAQMGTAHELSAQGKANAQDAAQRFYRRIASPVLLDPKVEFNGLPVEDVYPKAIPDLFSAGPVILKGRYTRPADGNVTISGLLHGRPWSQTIHVRLPALKQDGEVIRTLWARERIEDLQSRDWFNQQTGRPDPEVQKQIVNVALEYRLLSQHTSFVAVEEKVVNIGGKQRTFDVPVEMPEGVSYEGIFGEGRIPAATLGVQTLGRAVNGFGYGRGGGLGGGGALYYALPAQAGAALAAPSAAPRKQSAQTQVGQVLAERESLASIYLGDELRLGDKKALKDLDALKPEERRAVLRKAKVAEVLQKLAELVKKEGSNGTLHKPGLPEVNGNCVEVQVWLNDMPPGGMDKLKGAMFKIATTLIPNKLILGVVNLDKLDALVELPFVRLVEPPRVK